MNKFLIRWSFHMNLHTNNFEIFNEYVSFSNKIGKGIIVNIGNWSESYLGCAAKFAVHYSHTDRCLTDLNVVWNFAANRDSMVKKKLPIWMDMCHLHFQWYMHAHDVNNTEEYQSLLIMSCFEMSTDTTCSSDLFLCCCVF